MCAQEVGGACSAPCECNGGCPYKTYDAQQLRTALSRLNCNERCVCSSGWHELGTQRVGFQLWPSLTLPVVLGQVTTGRRLETACTRCCCLILLLLRGMPAHMRVLDRRVVKDVLDKVRGKHYQLACGLAFEGITGAQQETGINKPSEYYAASIELEKTRAAAAAAAAGGGAAEAVVPPQQQQVQQQQQGPPSTPMAAAQS